MITKGGGRIAQRGLLRFQRSLMSKHTSESLKHLTDFSWKLPALRWSGGRDVPAQKDPDLNTS